MEVNAAYQLLSDYQLLSKDNSGLARVFEVQEKYEKFRPYIWSSSSPLTNRISNVLEACSSIEESVRKEAEQVLEDRKKYSNYADVVDFINKRIIAQVGKPLIPCPRLESHPAILEVYKKHKARTWTQKTNALEKEMNAAPGRSGNYYFRGEWREPKWKIKQMKLRCVIQIYLLENGLTEVK